MPEHHIATHDRIASVFNAYPLRQYTDQSVMNLIAGSYNRQYSSHIESEEEIITMRPLLLWFDLKCNLTIPAGTALSQIRSLFSIFEGIQISQITDKFLATIDHPLVPRTVVSDDFGNTERIIFDGRLSAWETAPNMIIDDLRGGADVCVIASDEMVFRSINSTLERAGIAQNEFGHLYYHQIQDPEAKLI